MHVLVLKREIAERDESMPQALYRAFSRAKEIAMQDLWSPGALRITLPWISEAYRRTVDLMGPDFWPYGVAANREAIMSISRYIHAQGLAPRQLAIEDLFARSVLNT